jgi:outer membrane protein OmpA-like peptidoglycan-associated protein
LVGGSPSETLFRVLLSAFRLDKVSTKSIVSVKSADEVVKRFRAAKPAGNEVFITWEPYVSQLEANGSMQVLLDTSRQSGYIVDALVVNREFLLKHEAVVRQLLEAYFRVLYSFREPSDLAALIQRDAAALGTPITAEQAPKLVEGIQWKNTQENYAHFGLINATVPHVENIINRIKRVLLETQGLISDPTGGDSTKLFYERALRELSASGFHPGLSAEEIRGDAPLQALSDAQWQSLVSVGTLSSPPLIFARGRATLTEASQAVLDELVSKLESWPAYYVKVMGNSGSVGDAAANRQLAIDRAQSALEYLQSKGVPPSRIRALAGTNTAEMSVTFVFGQLPF